MTRLAGVSRLLRARRVRARSRLHAPVGFFAEREAVLAANRERLRRFIVARGAGAFADDILDAIRSASPSGDLDPEGAANAMFRMAERLIVARSRSPRRAEANGAARGDRRAAVDAALKALGGHAATVFRRHRVDGIPLPAVARELGIDLAAVERDLARAYAALVELRESSPGSADGRNG